MAKPKTIKHPEHRHELAQYNRQVSYTCDGCQEKGRGLSYRCRKCSFYLHGRCALARESSKPLMHFLHNEQGHLLKFRFGSKDRKTNFFPPCKACGKAVQRFKYCCELRSCDFVLHPCCAHVPRTMKLPLVDNSNADLSLRRKLKGPCGICRKDFSGWAYTVARHDYSFHVGCWLKKLLNMAKRGRSPLPATQQLRLVRKSERRPRKSGSGTKLCFKFMEVLIPKQRVRRSTTQLVFKLTVHLIYGILGTLIMGNPAPLPLSFVASFLT